MDEEKFKSVDPKACRILDLALLHEKPPKPEGHEEVSEMWALDIADRLKSYREQTSKRFRRDFERYSQQSAMPSQVFARLDKSR